MKISFDRLNYRLSKRGHSKKEHKEKKSKPFSSNLYELCHETKFPLQKRKHEIIPTLLKNNLLP